MKVTIGRYLPLLPKALYHDFSGNISGAGLEMRPRKQISVQDPCQHPSTPHQPLPTGLTSQRLRHLFQRNVQRGRNKSIYCVARNNPFQNLNILRPTYLLNPMPDLLINPPPGRYVAFNDLDKTALRITYFYCSLHDNSPYSKHCWRKCLSSLRETNTFR